MAENPAKEYWKRAWLQAYNNIPRKIIKKKPIWGPVRYGLDGKPKPPEEYEYNVPTQSGKASTLMLLLGKPMFSKNGVRRTHHLHYQAAQRGGHRPKDPEVRRRLEILAGPNGRIMAWVKLKELGVAHKYEHP